MQKFIFAPDIHWGYERKNGHKVPLHDPKAVNAMLKFAADFEPDVFILGGDSLDCGAISHHNKNKAGNIEGLRLLTDAKEFIEVKEAIEDCSSQQVYMIGNHEDWLQDITTEMPGLSGLLDIEDLLELGEEWKVIPQGGVYNLGKLSFVHGDQLKGGEHIAKASVITYERSIRFGHFHTYQTYTKTSPLDFKLAKTGIAVPCLCSKNPSYGQSKPNKWTQGFLYGYIDGPTFNDYVAVICEGKFTAEGKTYKG